MKLTYGSKVGVALGATGEYRYFEVREITKDGVRVQAWRVKLAPQ